MASKDLKSSVTDVRTQYRTVLQCDDEITLRWALMGSCSQALDPTSERPSSGSCMIDHRTVCDWHTPHLDPTSSHPQSVDEEVKRLMNLKEYSILSAEEDENFNRITSLGSRIFNVPICLISLVDIGRQWFMSNRGLGNVRETSRQVSFCSHAIQSKEDLFIILETHEDCRFKNNALVTGPPYIRFYAGAPLTSPEGFKLGTLCVIDNKPRSEGLTSIEKQNLRELSDMVMDNMVNRKKVMDRMFDEKTKLIACAAHDMLSPLTGIQLNLSMLKDDDELATRLSCNQKDILETSLECSKIMERICVQAIERFCGELRTHSKSSDVNKSKKRNALEEGPVNIRRLIKNVEQVISIHPKEVPLFIDVDVNVPSVIISDELKLFRSILNYLTNACKHTKTGSISLRIYAKKASNSIISDSALLSAALIAPKKDMLVVECEDSGPGIPPDIYPTLFMPLRNVDSSSKCGKKMHNYGIGLYSVANEIGSLGGEYGLVPLKDFIVVAGSHCGNDRLNGCVFWFTVPLVLPESSLQVNHRTGVGNKWTSLGPNTGIMSSSIKTISDTTINNCQPTTVKSDRELEGWNLGHSALSLNAKNVLSSKDATDISLAYYVSTLNSHDILNSHQIKTLVKSDDDPFEKSCCQRTKCVLIIDDSLTIRKAFSMGFKRLGFEVKEAVNGLEGFKCLQMAPYDIVILDFLMPLMDGIEVAEKFRAWEKVNRPWFHQFIVGLSAHANTKDSEMGLKAGMDIFMSKPCQIKTLKDLAKSEPALNSGILLDQHFGSIR